MCQSPRWFVKRERRDAELRSAYEKSHGITNVKTCSVEWFENFTKHIPFRSYATWKITNESLNFQCGTVSVMDTAFAFASSNKKLWCWEVENSIPFIDLFAFLQVFPEFCTGSTYSYWNMKFWVSVFNSQDCVNYNIRRGDDLLVELNF